MEGSLTGDRACRIPVRVRYSEVDRMGLLYHVNYLEYFELARSEWIRRFWKPYRRIEDEGLMLVVVEAHLRFHRPAYYDELLEIEARLEDWGRSRLTFAYRIFRTGDDKPLCTGRTGHCFVTGKGELCRIPERLRELLGAAFGNPGKRDFPGREP